MWVLGAYGSAQLWLCQSGCSLCLLCRCPDIDFSPRLKAGVSSAHYDDAVGLPARCSRCYCNSAAPYPSEVDCPTSYPDLLYLSAHYCSWLSICLSLPVCSLLLLVKYLSCSIRLFGFVFSPPPVLFYTLTSLPARLHLSYITYSVHLRRLSVGKRRYTLVHTQKGIFSWVYGVFCGTAQNKIEYKVFVMEIR